MKTVILTVILALGSISHAETCSAPADNQDHFICESLISSELKGDTIDKVSAHSNTPSYKLWLNADKKLCMDGKIANLRGSGGRFHESDLPQGNEQLSPTRTKTFTADNQKWILSMSGMTDKSPNRPANYEHIHMDLINLTLTVSKTLGTKSFVTFDLKCVNKNSSQLKK